MTKKRNLKREIKGTKRIKYCPFVALKLKYDEVINMKSVNIFIKHLTDC